MTGWGDSPWGTMPWGAVAGWGDGQWGDFPWGGEAGIYPGPIINPPGAPQIQNYRLVLAGRGTSGLGTAIIDNVLELGLPTKTEYACRWSRTLNAAGTIEFTLPLDGPGVTPENFYPGRELHLFRDDGTGERIVWAGHLWASDVQKIWVRFLGMGFYEDLRHREIGTDFYKFNTEQRSIAWQMIDYTQTQPNGNLGITRETSAGSATQRTVAYCAEERQNIAEAIEDLASADDGFDFEVGPDKIWRTWVPKRGSDLSATVELSTNVGIVEMAYTSDGTQIENEVAGIGKKGNCEPIHYVVASDSTSQTKYGLMQGTISRSDLKWDDDMISAQARQRLALQSQPRKQPTVRLFNGLGGPNPLNADFDLGDVISVDASWGFATFNDNFRVMSYDVSFDRVGYEFIDVTLDAVV